MNRQRITASRRHCRHCDVEWQVSDLPCFNCGRYGFLGPLPSTPRSSFERFAESRAQTRSINPQEAA